MPKATFYLKLLPQDFSIVFAFAGLSTINKFVAICTKICCRNGRKLGKNRKNYFKAHIKPPSSQNYYLCHRYVYNTIYI